MNLVKSINLSRVLVRFSAGVALMMVQLHFPGPGYAAQQERASGSGTNLQDQRDEEQVTVRGQLVLESELIDDFDWDTMEGVLGELVELQQAAVPENWSQMATAERQKWIAGFEASEEGKRLIAANQKRLDERTILDFQIRDDGRFVVYDVPVGHYELEAVAQINVADQSWVLQCFGQFEVGNVHEVDLNKMPVDVLRLLKQGEEAPELVGTSCAGDEVTLSGLRGKYVLLTFGLTANPDFQITTSALREAAQWDPDGDKLAVLTVTVDEDISAVARFNTENKVDWNCLNLGKWDEQVLGTYGLKMVPSLWLIDPQGKIVLTGRQFQVELIRTQWTVAKLVEEALAGRLVIGGEEKSGDPEDDPSKIDRKSDDR